MVKQTKLLWKTSLENQYIKISRLKSIKFGLFSDQPLDVIPKISPNIYTTKK